MTKEKRHYLQDLLDYLQITAASFAKSLGYESPNKIYHILRLRNGMSIEIARDITRVYPSISYEWLLNGEGNMLKDLSNEDFKIPNDGKYRLLPIINADAVGGMHKMNDISESEHEYIKGYIPFVNAFEDDLCIPITSDSMIPTCPPGCLVQIRKVENWKEYFGFGNLFVIQLKDGRRIIKEVTKYEDNPRDYVLCISHNSTVPAEELPKDFIVSVWKVIKVLTDRGW